jgi:hypothetical protein
LTKKNKIEGHGLLSCDDLHEPQNTHKHNKKTFIAEKNGGGDFTTGGEIFKFAILRAKIDHSFWHLSWKFFSCRLQL